MKQSWYLYFLYFTLGLTTSLNVFSIRKDVQAYKLSIAETSFVLVPALIPWGIKCLFADICQRISHRKKPFMMSGNFFAAIICWLFMLDNLQFNEFLVLLVLLQICVIIPDNGYDGLMLILTQSEETESRGKIQTNIETWREIGNSIGVISGSVIWSLIGSKGVYGILSGFYIFSIIVCFFMPEKDQIHMETTGRIRSQEIPVIELDENGNDINTVPKEPKSKVNNCAYTLGNLHQAWLHPILRPLMLFTIVTGLFPSPSTPMFYFMNDQLKYTPTEMSIRATASQLASILAVFLAYRFARYIPMRILFASCIILRISLGLVPLLLVQTVSKTSDNCNYTLRNVTHWKNNTCYQFETMNIDPLVITCTSDAFEDAVDAFGMFPLKGIATLICSSMLEITVYSFILSVLNITGALRGVVDSFFISRFGIDHGQYGALASFTIFCSILDLLSLCFVPMLPNICVQDISSDITRQKEAKEVLSGEFSSIVRTKSTRDVDIAVL